MAKANRQAAAFSTHRPVLDFITFALSLLGILVVVHLMIQSGRGFDRGCFGFSAPDPTFNCEAVVNSDAGKLMGVSNVYWGLGFYLIVAALSFLVLLRNGAPLRKIKTLRAFMLIGGLCYSSYLSYVQYFQLGEFCKLCIMSASIVVLMFITMLREYFTRASGTGGGEDSLIRKVPFWGGLAAVTALLAIVDVAYFNSLESGAALAGTAAAGTEQLAQAAPGECRFDSSKPRLDDYMEMVSFSDPSKGNPNAPVTVIEFFDPNCPHCKTMVPVLDQVIADYSDKARFVYRPFVLGPASMRQVEALYAAAQEGTFFEMLNGQFQRQTNRSLTMEELQSIALESGMDWDLLKHRLDNQMFRNIAVRHRNAAADAGVNVVPTIMINGRIIESASKTVDCIKELIDRSTP